MKLKKNTQYVFYNYYLDRAVVIEPLKPGFKLYPFKSDMYQYRTESLSKFIEYFELIFVGEL